MSPVLQDYSCFTVLGMFFVFSFLVLFIFTGGLQKTKFFATIPRVDMRSYLQAQR